MNHKPLQHQRLRYTNRPGKHHPKSQNPLITTHTMKVTVEFGGGLDTLFGKVPKLEMDLPELPAPTLLTLISVLRDDHVKERPELFWSNDSLYVCRAVQHFVIVECVVFSHACLRT